MTARRAPALATSPTVAAPTVASSAVAPSAEAPHASADAWPRITVVVPSLDQGAFLEAALRSILDQGYPNLELIAVDGGSRDQSVTILERYAEHFAWWCSELDRGQAHAVNKGFRRATGTILGWLNSDDLLLPGSLARIARAFRDPATRSRPVPDAVTGLRREVHEDGTLGAPWFRDLPTAAHLRRYCCLAQETVYFHRRVYEHLGGLDESMAFALDYEYWLRMIAHGYRFTSLPAFLGGCRDHPRTKRATAVATRDHDVARLLERHQLGRNEEEAMMRAGPDAGIRMALLEDLCQSPIGRRPRLALAAMHLLERPAWARSAASLYRGYRSRRPRQSGRSRLRAISEALWRALLRRPQPDAFELRLLASSPVQRPAVTGREIARPHQVGDLPADTLALGAGWSWLERATDCVYRWGRSGAEVMVLRPSGKRKRLRLDLQSGPSLDWQPFDLTVRDEADRVIASRHVDQRATVVLPLPLSSGPHKRSFRLQTNTHNKTAAGLDARVLDFRATFVGWEEVQPRADLPQHGGETVEIRPTTAEAGDIVPAIAIHEEDEAPRDGLFLGAGWSTVTQDAAGPWRTIQHAADLVVTRASGQPRRLAIVAELDPRWRSGTIAAASPLVLRMTAVADADTKPLTQNQLLVRDEPIRFALHLPRGRHVRLRLQPAWRTSTADPRWPASSGPTQAGVVRVRAIRWHESEPPYGTSTS